MREEEQQNIKKSLQNKRVRAQNKHRKKTPMILFTCFNFLRMLFFFLLMMVIVVCYDFSFSIISSM